MRSQTHGAMHRVNGSKLLEAKIYWLKGAKDPRAMDGLPVCVQIIGQPWGEEKVLAIMHIVDAALGPCGFGPGSWTPRKQVGGASNSQVIRVSGDRQ
jgi:hypothetical protein